MAVVYYLAMLWPYPDQERRTMPGAELLAAGVR